MYRHNNISQFEYVISFHPLITYDCNKWVIPGFPQLFPQCGAAKQGILRNPDRTRTRTWTRTRRKSGLGKNPDSCSDSRLRNPDSTIENPDSKSKILDSMKLDSDNIRNKFSSLICFWVFFSDMSKCLVMN